MLDSIEIMVAPKVASTEAAPFKDHIQGNVSYCPSVLIHRRPTGKQNPMIMPLGNTKASDRATRYQRAPAVNL
jgi:hypothetical protein